MGKLPSPQEMYDDKRAQALASSHYPPDWIHKDFLKLLHDALRYCSLHKVGCHYLTWKQMINPERVFYMAEMDLCFLILKGATPFELGQTLEQNIEMHENVLKPMSEKWYQLENDICEPIKREIEVKIKLSNSAPIGKKIIQV
jgi:hypothetical protein